MEKNPVRKNYTLGLLALVVLGLILAMWAGSKTSTRKAEPIPTASESVNLQPCPARHSAAGSRVLASGHSAAEQGRLGRLGRLWAAFQAAQNLTDPMEQQTAWNRCMEGITPEMAAALLASLKPEDLKSDAALRLFDHWATANPADAVAWSQGLADPESRQSFLNLAAMRWAVTDLKEAAAWVCSLPEGDSRTEIMAAVGSEAVRSDPLVALGLGTELPEGTAQTNIILRAAAEWSSTDRDSAMEWAKQIEDKDLRQQVTGQIVVASAEQDPVGAATIALQQMSPGEEQDRSVVSIVQRWVQTDPVGASAWVSGFPEGTLGRDAMENLINLWAQRDLVASGNWLLTLRMGESRNVGIRAYASVLKWTDAEQAERWASSVTDGL